MLEDEQIKDEIKIVLQIKAKERSEGNLLWLTELSTEWRKRQQVRALETKTSDEQSSPASSLSEKSVIRMNPMRASSASQLSSTDDMAMIGLPLPPGCYNGNPLVTQLVSDFECQLNSELSAQIESQLLHNNALSYRKHEKSEEFTQPNLVRLLDLIDGQISVIAPALKESFSVKVEQNVKDYVSFFLAKHNSKPEGGVVFVRGRKKFLVVGAEAKGLNAGAAEAYAQATSLACDGALDQIRKGVPYDKVLVPFMLVFGDCVQFGAVYVLAPSFPCAVLLSHPLSLLSWDTRGEICRWVRAVGLLCVRQAAHFGAVNMSTSALQKIKCDLVGSVFLKPVQADLKEARYNVCHLMSIYQLLFLHEECKKFVHFPLGTMGLPQEGESFREDVLNLIRAKFKPLMQDFTTGWPIIIYPRLSKEWRNAAQCIDQIRPVRAYFLKLLKGMLKFVAKAGVIHLDVRLPNIMVKMPPSSSSSNSSSAMELLLIDWDCSARVGHPIDPSLLDRYARDERYPSDLSTANKAYHKFFLKSISKQLAEGAGDETRAEAVGQSQAGHSAESQLSAGVPLLEGETTRQPRRSTPEPASSQPDEYDIGEWDEREVGEEGVEITTTDTRPSRKRKRKHNRKTRHQVEEAPASPQAPQAQQAQQLGQSAF